MSSVVGDEEEKGVENVETTVRDHIHKLKLIECLNKSVDRLVTLSNSDKQEDFFLILDSSIFALIAKNLETLTGFKPKSFNQFI